jgi:hypothetical protein
VSDETVSFNNKSELDEDAVAVGVKIIQSEGKIKFGKLHILRFIHFCDNISQSNRTERTMTDSRKLEPTFITL